MNARYQWNLKGVSEEARNAAKMAAEKTGQSLGVWVERAIMNQAQADLKGKNLLPQAAEIEGRLDQFEANIDKKIEASFKKFMPAQPKGLIGHLSWAIFQYSQNRM